MQNNAFLTWAILPDSCGAPLICHFYGKFVAVNRKPWSVSEHPDAIGWLPNGESIGVECKVSVSDFRADHYKPWRKHSKGMGFRRYFMVPTGLIDGGSCPAGIGWLEFDGKKVKVMREAEARQDRGWAEEVAFLLAQVSPSGREFIDLADQNAPKS